MGDYISLKYPQKVEEIDSLLIDIFNHRGTYNEYKVASRAYQICESAVNDGLLFADFLCSELATIVEDTPTSRQLAWEWAKKSTSKEYALGYYKLGLCYEKGLGVPLSLSKAHQNYDMAINLGFGIPALNFSYKISNGLYPSIPINRAMEYAMMAYDLGEDYVATMIGDYFADGKIIEQNINDAIKWYKLGSKAGHVMSTLNLVMINMKKFNGININIKDIKKYEKLLDYQINQQKLRSIEFKKRSKQIKLKILKYSANKK